MGRSSKAIGKNVVETEDRNLKVENKTDMIYKEYMILKEVFKNLPEYVMFVCADGKIRYANQNMAEFAGVDDPEELVGKKPTEISKIHPHFMDAARRLVNAIKNRERLEDLEIKVISADGDEILLSASVYPVYVNGEYIGCLEVFNTKIVNILDSIPIPIIVLDKDHRIAHWNRAIEVLTGFKAEDMVGTRNQWKPFYESERPILADIVMKNPEDAHRYYSSINKSPIIKGAFYATGSFKFNGKERFLRFTAAPIYDAKGEVTGAVETLEDLTDLKEKEEEVKEFAEYVKQSLNTLSDGLKKLSEGNLNVRLEAFKTERFSLIDLLGYCPFEVFNEFAERLQRIVETLAKDMKETVEQIKQASDAVKQMNAGMEQISSASQQIATASENLSRLANSSMAEVKAAEQIFGDLNTATTEADEFATSASKDAKESREEGKKALETLNMILEEIEKMTPVVNSLESAVREIGKVTERIKSIADQTNLLALNAAIEAARAGEYGRGFAVVADEIRKLAEESRKSTEEINEIIRNVQDETKKVIDAAMSVKNCAAEGSKGIESALARAAEIAEKVNKISEMLKEVSKKAKEGLTKIEQIARSFEEVASTAEENAASSEETSAAIEEQTAAIQQVSMSMENINKIANKILEELIKNFKIFIDSSKSN